jgi:hypothetical protein
MKGEHNMGDYHVYMRNVNSESWFHVITLTGINISFAFIMNELEKRNNKKLRFKITRVIRGMNETVVFEQMHPHGD